MGRAAGRRGRTSAGADRLSDILAAQPADAATLAEVYDLEHDAIVEDLGFYRAWAGRQRGPTLDLGCGSGRLFRPLFEGGATRIVGIDGSAALLERARRRIAGDELLAAAEAAGRLELVLGDARALARRDHFELVVIAGVLAHLDGPEDAVRALSGVATTLTPTGVALVDHLGPGGLPPHDLPLSVDWERRIGDRRVVRRSSLVRHEAPEGLRVEYRTLTDLVEADGTIARLPAGFRLWYPSPTAVVALAAEAGLELVAAFGSHEQAPLEDGSERCIVVLRRASSRSIGTG